MIICAVCFFLFNESATPEIYTFLHTLSLHDALPISLVAGLGRDAVGLAGLEGGPVEGDGADLLVQPGLGVLRGDLQLLHPARCLPGLARSEEHTSELQSLMRISYAVFCLQKKKRDKLHQTNTCTH